MTDRPLRALLVGAGGMGRGWSQALARNGDVQLVGIADIDDARAEELAHTHDHDVATAKTLDHLLETTIEADFVVDVTIPEAHHAVTMTALNAGLPVLGEKPLAATLPEALELVATAEATQTLFMVSQNRRYIDTIKTFKAYTQRLGALGAVVANFFKAPHFGGFRDEMAHPLILDMAIHTFDGARFLTDQDPVAVYCDEYNPPWSWYAGDAATTAIFELIGGLRFVYTGSWCSPGQETSWNSAWRVSGANGTAQWDGDNAPTLELTDDSTDTPDVQTMEHSGLDGSLREFVEAVRNGSTPMGECHDNVVSLAMVHAAIVSATTQQCVLIADVLEQARTEALTRATGPALDVLKAWTTLIPPSR
ncbi:Gfo/Idh/MocA family protein [Tenggerimyces flavus]|uniref:Gfo/Idh/MocA family protein n=1 Tax=Tenggerimyces flavus TaxID=1708749 RepID=A0ABV7YF11_9ACTN|nr:Gfo/Idh/MocA family oxidoreductase [Tenggerimyces flavus]MBM7789232.1 putative dehydrogenase [Tenggerimyces flavus]